MADDSYNHRIEDLLTKIKAGDGDALATLLRDNFDNLYATCFRILRHDADAADATQQALINIARNINTFSSNAAITTWMYRIAANAALDIARSRKRSSDRLAAITADAPTDTPDPTESIVTREAVSSALAQLPDEFRVAVVLRDIADLDYSEIAGELQIPIGTVRSRIARGRAQLAEILNPDSAGTSPPSGASKYARKNG